MKHGDAETRRCVAEHIAFRSLCLAASADEASETHARRAVQYWWSKVVHVARARDGKKHLARRSLVPSGKYRMATAARNSLENNHETCAVSVQQA